MTRFFLLSLAVVLGLYAIGYYPSTAWEPHRGSFGLLCGLTLALVLMAGSCAVWRWVLFRSQRLFLTVFGTGFIVRLVIVVLVFFLYVQVVGEAIVTFAVSFGVGYLSLSLIEYLSLKDMIKEYKVKEDKK